MSHGTLGTPSHGLSKALSMGLVLIICPLKINEPMNFKAAWYACDMKGIKPLHLTLLSLLNEGVTQNFWVRTWVKKGLGKIYRIYYHINFQILQQTDGTDGGLAAGWPTTARKLTYCSGNQRNLPTELLIQWDLVSQAIQKLLNVNNINDPKHPIHRFNKPKLETYEFIRNDEAHISYPGDIEDNMPDMLNGPVYNKHVMHAYTENEEEKREYFFLMNLILICLIDYQYLRDHFRENMFIRFSHIHPDSLWDRCIVRLILSLWELCQTYGVAMVYTGEFSRGRNHLNLQDFRITGNYSPAISEAGF